MLVTLTLVLTLVWDTSNIEELGLRDQHGREDRVAEYKGDLVMVMIISAKRLRKLKHWEVWLRESYPAIQLLRVADVPPDSTATEKKIADTLGSRVPAGIDVLIDMERAWARSLDLDTSTPNLMLFDKHAKLRVKFKGPPKEAFLEEVSGHIEQVMSEQ